MKQRHFGLRLFEILLLWLLVPYGSNGSSKLYRGPIKHRAARVSGRSAVTRSFANKDAFPYDYETRYFTQALDHFSFKPESYRTFQQRYLLSTKNWAGAKRNAPIFLYCGNEGDIVWFAENTGFMWELAPRFGAMVVFPEHRYYGESVPEMALQVKNASTLAYLSSEQALADYAIFITELKRNFSAEASPVVAFGGSYGGMLAAWFRLKYPHIVIGALSSSAPILQFDDIVPSDTYLRIVSEDFKNASQSCFETIRDSWKELNAIIQKKGASAVAAQLGFCSDAHVDIDLIQDFFETAWSTMAMTDYPYAANFVMPLPANPVNAACFAIDGMPKGSDIISRLFAGANIYWNSTGDVKCFDVNSDPHGEDLWSWQQCTEMVMPYSSNPENSIFPAFPFDLQEMSHECAGQYGITPRPHWITEEYGGHDIKTVLRHYGSNIIFSNGLLDPWSGGGVLEDISDSIIALVTPKGAHHLDLRPTTEYDPSWLTKQRRDEIKLIKQWLKQYYSDSRATH
eukprot:c29263_g2_i2 orf=664-2202(-)